METASLSTHPLRAHTSLALILVNYLIRMPVTVMGTSLRDLFYGAGSNGCPSPAACKPQKCLMDAKRRGHFRVREDKHRKGDVVMLRQASEDAHRDTGLWCLGVVWSGEELTVKNPKQERGNDVE